MVKPLIMVAASKGILLKFQPSALKLLAKEGYDPEMGARPLRRLLQTKLEDPDGRKCFCVKILEQVWF